MSTSMETAAAIMNISTITSTIMSMNTWIADVDMITVTTMNMNITMGIITIIPNTITAVIHVQSVQNPH